MKPSQLSAQLPQHDLLSLMLKIGDWQVQILTDSSELQTTLAHYFKAQHIHSETKPQVTLYAITQIDPQLFADCIWQDWPREAGKSGRKDAYYDLDNDNRLVLKVKTGLVFWQNADTPAAFGELNRHPNQVINFILSQYLNHHLNQNWLLGHCAALQIGHQGVALAGLSGGGKSTLMLKLLEHGDHFISNDRLLIQAQQDHIEMRGLPKHPRINPGTLLNNPRLSGLIQNPEPYLALDHNALRQLEEKYDALIHQFYPQQPFMASAALHHLIILNWQLDHPQATQITQVDLNQRADLLAAVIKPNGPFFQQQHPPGFMQDNTPAPQAAYLKQLQGINAYEIHGRLDFNAAQQLIKSKVLLKNY